MQLKSHKDVTQAVVIAGLSALVTGLIAIVVKKIENRLDKIKKKAILKGKK